ncbi:Glycoside hydrolase family 35 protein [Mycena indigotica]|uniref:beta-galactosidase n=1 Tax=Mycena indigotica TaxID=2126181 RepID=A0A8H6SF33_9AGAR|nr:Glycoside hydrolase family 35 protein [Mycena indigotica]KAF7297192.1 Glycoside hydrolase family 35 protein [Mycena indigotica]
MLFTGKRLGAFALLAGFLPAVYPAVQPNLPRQTVSRTPEVQFDQYTLLIHGQRIFLHGAELHTFRLPVPSLWPDILEKFKAAGLNLVSVYIHMGVVNPSRGVVDFQGYRALQPLFDAAKAAGLWLILRPGPYINAESTAGGIAHWTTTEIAGNLRSDAADWRDAWEDYIQGIIAQTAPNQINHGGPVIGAFALMDLENPESRARYFQQLIDVYHASSIVVPLTYNDPGPGRNFINGTGAVDLYGMDSYFVGADCSDPNKWPQVPDYYHRYHQEVNPSQPWFFPEFQAGSFDGWGPNSPGYELCNQLTGPTLQSVFNKNAWASNAKLISYYMGYGGTSWGALPFPGSYTSYDYGSFINESRALTSKFDELKLQGMFIRSSPDFYKTDWISDGSTGFVTSNSAVFGTFLQNPDNKASFYILRQKDSTSTAITTLKLNITTPISTNLQVPLVVSDVTLGGRESKVVISGTSFGASRIDYTTAEIFFGGKIGDRDVLFLYGGSTQAHEIRLKLTGSASTDHLTKSSQITSTQSEGDTTIFAFQTGVTGLHTVYDSSTQLILYADRQTAITFWAPVIPGSGDLANFWSFGSNSTLLVGGPYLVRHASISGSTLALTGDLNVTAPFTVIAPTNVKSVTWNGANVELTSGISSTAGGFTGRLTPRDAIKQVAVPALTGWKYKDSLPEIAQDFDDSSWTLANRTTTNVPRKPYYGDGRVLYNCDYGYCENTVLWRGHFEGAGQTKMNLSINGGEGYAASVWLNDAFLGTSYGNSSNHRNAIPEAEFHVTFPEGAVRSGDNVITIVQDNMGHDQASSDFDNFKVARGVRGFQLDTGSFGDWKVQGKLGGYTGFLDKQRGVMNEGGLFGERKGWHLPGFDTSSWESRDLSDGLPNGSPGVGFFVTKFTLDIPNGIDAFISFTFKEAEGQTYRALLFVNGWHMGKRVGNLGQFKFPVHQGILDYHGENNIAVALWSMDRNAVSPKLQLEVDTILDGGVPGIVTANPAWSARGRAHCPTNVSINCPRG